MLRTVAVVWQLYELIVSVQSSQVPSQSEASHRLPLLLSVQFQYRFLKRHTHRQNDAEMEVYKRGKPRKGKIIGKVAAHFLRDKDYGLLLAVALFDSCRMHHQLVSPNVVRHQSS